jgi:hypothetical protein
MNWYKIIKLSFKINNFNDRNIINLRIKQFKEIIAEMNYCVKYVYQNSPHVGKILEKIGLSKLMSSYPKLKEMFEYARYKSRDNYRETSEIIQDIIKVLMNELNQLIKARKEFVEISLPNKIKEKYDRK